MGAGCCNLQEHKGLVVQFATAQGLVAAAAPPAVLGNGGEGYYCIQQHRARISGTLGQLLHQQPPEHEVVLCGYLFAFCLCRAITLNL